MKKLITEMEVCHDCEGSGILETGLVCIECGGEGMLPTGKRWVIEDYIGLNEELDNDK